MRRYEVCARKRGRLASQYVAEKDSSKKMLEKVCTRLIYLQTCDIDIREVKVPCVAQNNITHLSAVSSRQRSMISEDVKKENLIGGQ